MRKRRSGVIQGIWLLNQIENQTQEKGIVRICGSRTLLRHIEAVLFNRWHSISIVYNPIELLNQELF